MNVYFTLDRVLNAVALLVSVGGLIWSLKVERNRKKKRILWEDVQELVRILARQIRKDDFDPQVILAISGPPVIIAELLMLELGIDNRYLRICHQELAEDSDTPGISSQQVTTERWRTDVPQGLKKEETPTVLIVDDFILTGSTARGLRRVIVNSGFLSANVKTCAMLVASSTVKAGLSIDYLGDVVDGSDLRLPWGSGYREERIGVRPL